MTQPLRLEDLGLPGKRHEDWRWTDLSALDAALGAAPANDATPDHRRWLIEGAEGPVLVFVDGVYQQDVSAPGPVSVEAEPATATEGGPILAALAARGTSTVVRLSGGAGRVQIIHIATGGPAHLRLDYRVPANAEARIVETYVGGGAAWTNVALTASLGEGAKLRRAVRQLLTGGVWTESVTGEVAARGDYGSVALIAGADSVRSECALSLTGDDAHAHVDGTMVAGGRQVFDVVNRIHHAALRGTSGQTWRTVAADKAQASFSGRIEVARGAQKTDAQQSVKALLLDRTATANAKPELEIFADDVKCAHGATVGELDKAALFYLESRGLTPEAARTLLTEAFVADAFESVVSPELREALGRDALAALEGVS